jgi:hypothetical protein
MALELRRDYDHGDEVSEREPLIKRVQRLEEQLSKLGEIHSTTDDQVGSSQIRLTRIEKEIGLTPP